MKHLTIVLSEGCNLDCTYCNVNKRSTNIIDPDLCLAEFRKLRQMWPDERIKVDFFGGEPLMFMPLVKQLVDGMRDDPDVVKFMPTNGLLLTDNIVDYLTANDFTVSLSFDGLWQDKNRLQLTGKTTSQRIIAKRDLIRRLPNLRIHTMITQGCYNLLENHLYLQDLFGVNPELTLVRDVGVWNEKRTEKLLAGITEIFDWYIENASTVTMPEFIRFYLRHFLNYHIKHEEKHNCGAGEDAFFFSDNKLLPCTRFKDRPELIAEIPKYARMPECSTCEVRTYCEKGCLFEQIKNNGPIVELCTIYKHTYAEVSRMTAALKHNQQYTETVMEEAKNANGD